MKGGPLGLDTFSRCTAFCGVYERGMHFLSVTTVRWDLRANTYTLLCYGSLLSGGVSWLGLLGCRGGRRRRQGTCLLCGRRISRKIATSRMGFLDGPRDDDADWTKCPFAVPAANFCTVLVYKKATVGPAPVDCFARAQGLCVILLSGFMGTFCNTRR